MCICPCIVRPCSLEKTRNAHKKRTAFSAILPARSMLGQRPIRSCVLAYIGPHRFLFAPLTSFLFFLRRFLYALPRFPLRLFLESRFPRFLSLSFLWYAFPSSLSPLPGFLAPLSHPTPFSPAFLLPISFSCQSKSFFSALRLSCSPGYRPPFLVISFFRSVSLSVFSILFFHHRLCPCFFLCPLLCPSRICPFCIIKKRHALSFLGHAVVFMGLFLFFCLVFKDRLVAFRANQFFVSQHLFVKVYHFMAVRTFHFQKVAFVLVFVVLKQLVF